MTLKDIIDCASRLGYDFTEADAQNVIASKPNWYTPDETIEEAVLDYLHAFGG